MREEELINVIGGGITAALLNSIARSVSSIYELGKSIGSSIRRIKDGAMCPIK